MEEGTERTLALVSTAGYATTCFQRKIVRPTERREKQQHSLKSQSNHYNPNPLGNRVKLSDKEYKIILINMLKVTHRKSQ